MPIIDTTTAGGKLEAPVPQRIFRASVKWLAAGILLSGGGGQLPGALQAGATAIALPLTLVL